MNFGTTGKHYQSNPDSYLWKQDHSSKGDETQDATVHPQGTSGQRKMSTLGKEHSILAQDDV